MGAATTTNILSQPFTLPTPTLQMAPVLNAPAIPASGSILNFQPRVDVSAMQGSFRFNNDAPQFLFYPTFEEFEEQNNDVEDAPVAQQNLKTRDAPIRSGKRSKKSDGFCGIVWKRFC